MWLVLTAVIRLLEELSSFIDSRWNTRLKFQQPKQSPPAALTTQSLDEITNNAKRTVKTEGENTPNNPNDIPAPKKKKQQ
ncbi:hypothetical protein G6F37_009906 [Rhizopus arrhizus]|nr:hypothetical protein G6F38_003010 [Rhizopus arrhizus]KAG1153939.1 hypothetical protein G6F37_009906 [Rhizopus arrhizus]